MTSLALANSVSEALTASKNSNNEEAAKIWTQLANRGNASAMYNLANHYSLGKGVDEDKALSEVWLKNATRSGLVEAYLTLNSAAVATAAGSQLTFHSGPTYWLEKQEPTEFTLQLATSRNKKFIEKIYSEHQLRGQGGYYRFMSAGKNRYALVYGTYKTVAEAKSAIEQLPKSLRKSPPWVRKIQALHKISR